MLNYYENLKIDDLDSIVTKCYFLVVSNYPFSYRPLHCVLIMLVKTVNTIIVETTSSYSEPGSVSWSREKCGTRDPGYEIERFLSGI